MTPTGSNSSAAAGDLTAQETALLQETLKRCPPGTLEAACEFRRTKRVSDLNRVILGVIERYVERDLRGKLKSGNDQLRLVEDLGLDSLSLMEIIVMAEDVLQITVSNEELTKLHTVADVTKFVAAKIGE